MSSNAVKLTQKQKELIEKLGIMSESSGLQPAASRVNALLLICDATYLSFDEIMDTLNLSKGATSIAINLLLSLKKIEYFTLPGDRKRYFRARLSDWQLQVTESFDGLGLLAHILKEVLDNRTKSTVDYNNKLKDIISFVEFMHKEIPTLYKKWEKSRK